MREVKDVGMLLRKGLTLPEIYRLLKIENVTVEPIYRNINLIGNANPIKVATKQIYVMRDMDGNEYYLN
ncbi:MAG: hypothetical protein E6240_01880 [Clostridium butyricum]|nr:hypothetical protein [Clostridium butyricum]